MLETHSSNFKAQSQSAKPKALLRGRCYNFSLHLISFLDSLPNEKTCWVIADQLLRSGTSIGANVTEASASSSKLEFKKYFEIALKSTNETIYWLRLLEDTKKANRAHVQPLINEATEISRILGASVLTLKGKRAGTQL